MKIIFAGQTGLTDRTQALASAAAAAGHSVTVFTSQSTSWVYTLKSLFLTCWQKPQVVHIHGWKMAAMVTALTIFLPEAMVIWTVDHVPAWRRWLTYLVACQAAYLADSITAPRRDIQWQLLQLTGVRAEYIPDGYRESDVPLASPRNFRLWAKRYCLVTAHTAQELAWVAQAYQKTGSRKKLVVLGLPAEAVADLAQTYPFLQLVPAQEGRAMRSLMKEAAVIILGSRQDTANVVTTAMNMGRPLISLAYPLHEETIGVTAPYVQERDEARLTALIKNGFKEGSAVKTQAKRAEKRAYLHFRWERIFLDYWRLYQPATFLVPLDSAHSVRITQPSVQ